MFKMFKVSVEIIGPDTVLDDILNNHLPGDNFDYSTVIPLPRELRGDPFKKDPEVARANIKKYGHPSWVGWVAQHWGSGRNAAETTDIYTEPGKISFSFHAADTFPYPIFSTLSEMYPEVEIDAWYTDPNCQKLH